MNPESALANEAGKGGGLVLTQNINYLLRRAHSRADQLFHTVMADLDITPRQAALIYGVEHHDGSSISQLTHLTGMDRGTLSEMVPRLVRNGLIVQSRSLGDGRAMALSLTDRGREISRELNARSPALGESVRSTLPPEYHQLFDKMLSLMVGIETEVRIRLTDDDDETVEDAP